MAIKRWSGSAWVVTAPKRWSGSAQVAVQTVKRWSGSAWAVIWQSLTAAVSGFMNRVGSGAGSFDRATYSVVFTPGPQTPTAYSWSLTDFNGLVTTSAANAATFTVTGPTYNSAEINSTGNLQVYCDVTVGGNVIRTPTKSDSYKISGAG